MTKAKNGHRPEHRGRGKSLKARFWWIDVLYPLALGALLFTALTYMVYAGQPQTRLAKRAEAQLLGLSLGHGEAADRTPTSAKIVVVSAEPADLAQVGRALSGTLPDAGASAYARVIEALAAAGARSIFVHFDPAAHVGDQDGYAALTRALNQARTTSQVYLLTSAAGRQLLPKGVAAAADWAEDLPCQDSGVQVACPYLPDTRDFSVQAVLNATAAAAKAGDPMPPPWTSTQLNSIFPSYVLNLDPEATLAKRSFRQILAHQSQAHGQPTDSVFTQSLVFVGPDRRFAHAGGGGGQVRTVFDQPQGDAEVVGTPLHVFWAQIAKMFSDGEVVSVAKPWLIHSAALGFCLSLVVTMWTVGALATVLVFAAVIVLGPWLNGWAINYGQVYLPLFDAYYFGLATLVVLGLGHLSLASFHLWRLEARRQLHAQVADIKSNFIALLSHNLNTPVAKMQGMVALLVPAAGAPPTAWGDDARVILALITQLEYAIRSVLIAATVEEGALGWTARPVTSLSLDMEQTYRASLRRLGLALQAVQASADESEELLLPLTFDIRALSAAVAALVALGAPDAKNRGVAGLPAVVRYHWRRQGQLAITVGWSVAGPRPAAITILRAATPPPLRTLGGEAFFDEVLAGLVRLAVAVHHGTVHIEPAHGEAAAAVTLVVSPLS